MQTTRSGRAARDVPSPGGRRVRRSTAPSRAPRNGEGRAYNHVVRGEGLHQGVDNGVGVAHYSPRATGEISNGAGAYRSLTTGASLVVMPLLLPNGAGAPSDVPVWGRCFPQHLQ